MVAEGEHPSRLRTVNNKIDGLICHSLWEGNKFFRWARKGEERREGGGGPLFQFQKSQSISPPSPGNGWVADEGLQAEEGPQLPAHLSFFHHFFFQLPHSTHPHLRQHLSLIFLFIFFRLCFFPLRRSALLTPPTLLFPWRICNPERRRRKKRRRVREREQRGRMGATVPH